MARVILPDGSTLEVADGSTARHVAEQIGANLAKAAVAARIDGKLAEGQGRTPSHAP
jgi:threonyl-tRNA synthetase